MSIINRLQRLEKVIVISVPKPTLVYVLNPELTDDEQRKLAMANYRREHPGCQGEEFNFIEAVSEECKRLVERIMSGERLENPN